MEDLHAIFLPRFVAAARTRLAHAREHVGAHDPATRAKVVSDLHKLAGDAGLLGFTAIAKTAAACEAAFRCGQESAAALDELARVIEEGVPDA